MAKRKSLEESLVEIRALRGHPTSEESIQQLQKGLSDKSNHVVAAAAEIASELWIEDLEEALVEAFDRFMIDPLKTDPGCAAKAAITEALYRMDAYQQELFLRGIRHIQLEPVYGGKEDTAAKLRVASAMGLVGMGYPAVMVELVYLLADSELDARLGAIQAITNSRQEGGVPLLRFKALIGDEDPRVLLECFNALLSISPAESLEFVGDFLKGENVPVCEAAAVALGESQLDGAFELLRIGLGNTLDSGLRKAILLSIAMLRDQEAIDFLLFILADEPASIAQDALFALEMYRDDRSVWNRVETIAAKRRDIKL
jgi:HEAT repeat protein